MVIKQQLKAGDFSNFFPATALTVSPSDPVDVEATSNYIANLFAGIQINNALLLFGEFNQFLQSEIWTQKTIQMGEFSDIQNLIQLKQKY